MNQPPTLDQLRLAFERYLLAKVQLEELRKLGGAGSPILLKTMDEYRTMEQGYISGMIARRAVNAESKRAQTGERRRPDS
jgi:hypothetical protein